ncbi:MAG: TIR domain-containing protein [Cytophagales bacterium]|nr:TIR domain-containing protein [Cytophagales bacterium]
MKVYLGGTVNGSSWRDYVISNIDIEYFNPVVDDWNEEAHERELYERRHCHFSLYVITPKLTGFYSLAEVTDDAIKRPDRTIYCYLKEDGGDEFTEDQLVSLDQIGKRVERNGGHWFQNLDQVIHHLNAAKKQSEGFEVGDRENLDAYISYGRKSSREFVKDMSDYLTKEGIHTWHDDGLVPLEIRHLDQVNRLIEKADNFIFVISSHAVRSEYALRELEYAKKLKKRIIPVMHEQPHAYLDNLPFEIRQGKILYYTGGGQAQELFDHIHDVILEEREYVQKHTELLQKGLQWQLADQDPRLLLYGLDRIEASKWLKTTFENVRPPAVPSEIHLSFIEASEALNISKQLLHFLNRLTSFLTERKAFDNFIGIVSLANPISLVPQLITVLNSDDLSSVSEYTFGLFAFLNLCFALVGIKQKNLGMFISMFLSMIMNLWIIGVKLFPEIF